MALEILEKPIGSKIYSGQIETGIGRLFLKADDEALLEILFGDSSESSNKLFSNSIIDMAKSQIEEYFHGELRDFNLPVKLSGTEFQKRVWKALCGVEYGSTASYKDIAAAVGSPKAVRAVGGANNRNRLPIIIPCHRIIGADRRLVGYGGGLDIKIKLLEIEGIRSFRA